MRRNRDAMMKAHVPGCSHGGHRGQGRTSVHYEIGIFRDDEKRASAQRYLVHVYVDRATRRPIPLPRDLHTALQPLISK